MGAQVIYTKVKHRIFKIIQPHNGGGAASTVFDWFIIVLIIINVFLVILDTFSGFSETVINIFRYAEIISVVIFTIEYVLRVWTASFLYPDISGVRARLRYCVSFMAIVDLMAILPFYVPFIIPIDLRVLRIMRLLRLLRLLKVNRYTNALSTIGRVIKRKSTQLISSMLVLFILMVMASVIMYNIENEAQPDVFRNAFSGLWWSITTISTVGYGDIYPVTALGKVLSATIALLGIGLVAIPTGIISAGFIEDANERKVEGEKEQKQFCPYCGKKLE